MTDNIVIWRMT